MRNIGDQLRTHTLRPGLLLCSDHGGFRNGSQLIGKIPVIAGGLIETKAEVTEALCQGALAVSTGKQELWYS